MAQLQGNAIFQALTANGFPLVGGKIFTFIAGTSTPQNTFSDSVGVVPNTNPVILNASGQAIV